MHTTKMNVSQTIKDKEIPRWHPLQRVSRIALSRLSLRRLLFLLLILATLLFFLTPSYVNRVAVIDPEENDDQVLLELRKEFKSLLSMRGEFSTTKQNAIFITAHDLYNATGLTMLACEMAMAKKLNVLMIFVGTNSTEKVAFFLRANQFDRTTCPMAWYDARHEYSSLNVQENATESVLKDVVTALQPSAMVYLDDDADWFMQSLERVVYWKRPAISLIQLKRTDIRNLQWIGSLNPSALAGISLMTGFNCSLECSTNRYCYYNLAIQHRNVIPINTISSFSGIHSTYSSKIIHNIQSEHNNSRTSQTPSKMALRSSYPSSSNIPASHIISRSTTILVSLR